MNARDNIAARLWLSVPSKDNDEAKTRTQEMLDAYRAEVTAEALRNAAQSAAVIHQTCHRDRDVCAGCQVRADILDVLRSVADVIGEKSSRTADATPGPTGRVAQLLNAIRAARGRWTTVTAFRFYREHLRSLDHIPNTQLRAVARGDLRDLAAWGHLLRFEEPGRQYYTLRTRR